MGPPGDFERISAESLDDALLLTGSLHRHYENRTELQHVENAVATELLQKVLRVTFH